MRKHIHHKSSLNTSILLIFFAGLLLQVCNAHAIELWEDEQGLLSIDEVMEKQHSLFSASENTHIGYSDSVWWLKLTLNNQDNSPTHRYIHFVSPLLQSVTAYWLDTSGQLQSMANGYSVPLSQRAEQFEDIVFKINLAANLQQDVYLKVKSAHEINLALKVLSGPDFHALLIKSAIFKTAGIVLIVTLLLYNLFLWISSKDAIFKNYFFYQLGILSNAFAVHGLFVYSDMLANYSIVILFMGGVFFYLFGALFLRDLFADLNSRLIDNAAKMIVVVVLLHVPFLLVGNEFALQFYAYFGGGIIIVAGYMLIIYQALRAGHYLSKPIAIAWGVFLAGTLMYLAYFNGLLDSEFQYSILIAGMLESLIFSFVLAIRYRRKLEDLAAQEQQVREALLEDEYKKSVLVQQDNAAKELEILVQQRTAQLEDEKNKAEQAAHARAEFVSNMSHELRTPLNGVIGMLQVLSDTRLDSEQITYTHKAIDAAKHLLKIINGILDFSRIESQRMILVKDRFSIVDMIGMIETMLMPIANSKNIKLVFEHNIVEGVMLDGDETRLKQVMINLINNAIKFTREGGVEVSLQMEFLSSAECQFTFEVKDTGIGIADEQLPYLFDPFVQADTSITREFEGTGLGLSISQKIIKLMGGQIKVRSEPDKGSCFGFILQMPYFIEQTKPINKTNEADAHRVRFLCLVESLQAQKNLQKLFSLFACDCDYVMDIPDAIERLTMAFPEHADSCYDYVLLDSFPDGFDEENIWLLSSVISQDHPHLILLSDSDDITNKAKQLIKDDVLDHVLVKPLTPTMLISFIKPLPGRLKKQLDGVRVLLVEDNKLNADITERMLVAEGAYVVTTVNGEQAVATISKSSNSFDIVLMDVLMPVMGGLEAAKKLRRLGFLKPIIALTADPGVENKTACLKAGMNDYLAKPYERSEVISTVMALLGKYQ